MSPYVLKIPTHVAYEEWSELLATLAYTPRSHIYGVVNEHTTRGGYKVNYAIRGMYDLGFDSIEEINDREYGELHLTQVRLACDGTYGDDFYLRNYFNWNAEEMKWELDLQPIMCGYCDEDGANEYCV